MSNMRYSIKISMAVACAISFDDVGARSHICGDAKVERLKTGYRITGSETAITMLASALDRHDGFDLSPSTIRACNLTARKVRSMLERKIL
jgi:hypothetical protein